LPDGTWAVIALAIPVAGLAWWRRRQETLRTEGRLDEDDLTLAAWLFERIFLISVGVIGALFVLFLLLLLFFR
jgi:hypothetical protein